MNWRKCCVQVHEHRLPSIEPYFHHQSKDFRPGSQDQNSTYKYCLKASPRKRLHVPPIAEDIFNHCFMSNGTEEVTLGLGSVGLERNLKGLCVGQGWAKPQRKKLRANLPAGCSRELLKIEMAAANGGGGRKGECRRLWRKVWGDG